MFTLKERTWNPLPTQSLALEHFPRSTSLFPLAFLHLLLLVLNAIALAIYVRLCGIKPLYWIHAPYWQIPNTKLGDQASPLKPLSA